VADQLFRDDAPAILAAYHAYEDIEFTAEWTAQEAAE